MNNLFTNECLSVGVSRTGEGKIQMEISSDYVYSRRKSQIHVNVEMVGEEVQRAWKSIKTKKLDKLMLSFDEIDWYDDMTDVYDTPVIHMTRGQKKYRVGYRSHGSIPKDWSVNVSAQISDTTTKTPIMEVVNVILGTRFTPEMEKKMTKELKSFLQKKINYFRVVKEEE